jgi:hypothetical protein
MPLQNRVNPRGEICFSERRGTLMGNRGNLHNENKEIVRKTKITGWVTCLLDFKGRKRQVMAPGRYTELFFLKDVGG